jgi:hypothetical protein
VVFSTTGKARTFADAGTMSWLGIFTHFPEVSNSRPWYGHLTTLPISLPIDSGAAGGSSGLPAQRRCRRPLGKEGPARREYPRLSVRVTSWSQAATYQALRTNMSDLFGFLSSQKNSRMPSAAPAAFSQALMLEA